MRHPSFHLFLSLLVASAHSFLAPASVRRVSVPRDAGARALPVRLEAFSFDPFDREVFRILMDAQSEARVLGAGAVGTQHLLLAATLQKDDVQASLGAVGITADTMRAELRDGKSSNLPGLDRLFAATAKDELLPFAKDTERSLKASVQRSKEEGGALSRDELVTWRELVLTVLQDDEADAGRVIAALGTSSEAAYNAVVAGERELVGAGGERVQRGNTTLSKCSTDLTQQARMGKLDPVVGRADEVKRCMQILVRRRKNNPVLIGDPGVGKTAIAEGLAQMIVDGNAPPRLKDVRLLSLELGLLVADTKYRGEFEGRLREVIDEVTKSPNTVLFIDEIHTLVGAGAAEGAIDAANLLKPALARGELQCIGATTVTEYRQYIEKDAALERRFQPVNVPEPSIEQTVEILGSLRGRYEAHHNVTYTPDALEAAAKLAERYLPDRFLPDKAIDLMDEAGAIVQINAFEAGEAPSAPGSFVKVGTEQVAEVVSSWQGIPLTKLTAAEASAMLSLEDELHERVIGQGGAVSAISRALRRAKVGLRSPRRPVASMIFCGPTGVGKTELAKAVASLYYGEEKAMVRLDMSEYMEAHSVSRLTGPPPGYVGYDAGGQLTEAVRRTPHTVVLFDEVEKAHPDVFNMLLQVLEDGRLTDNKGRMIDFSNAMLILTSNVGSRRILQMAQTAYGAGVSTTADGDSVTVRPAKGKGGSSSAASDAEVEAAYGRMRAAVKGELGTKFRPEFLNRLDEIIVFESLRPAEVTTIAGLMLDDLAARCTESDVKLKWTPALAEIICRSGFSPTFGARPLRRAVQRLCEDSIAEAMLGGFALAGDILEVDGDKNGDVVLRNPRGESRVHRAAAAQGIEEEEGTFAFDAAKLAEGAKTNVATLP